ncbi:MAG TPA: thiamine pyrophosphate-dependent enzyme [Acidimicrobiia bacterium]|nr:thiamine pyrophosphate-dependent enzyme [Acidimicrobiia bacterium]
MTVTIAAPYRNDTPYPFCPGCGHGSILDSLDQALLRLGLDPAGVVIVTDIGCAGLSDQYFSTSAFHGLHGRSITYATGIKLARPELTVIVIMGDGGTGIGGAHLINAARRNVGITVLVFNNLNFGMTGGQHSTTTPDGAITSTTPGGNLEHPLDICGTVGVNGAGYVYRGTSFDPDLPDRIAAAITHPGFALLDIWELCTAYFVPANKGTRRTMEATIERLGLERGVLLDRPVTDYGTAYRAAADTLGARREAPTLPVEHPAGLTDTRRVLVAGSAGAKVRSAARLIGEAAIRSGLWVTQRDDYPVTVKTGHSVSEVTLSPEPLAPVGGGIPDVVVIASADGMAKVRGALGRMSAAGLVVTIPEFGDLSTPARVLVVDPAQATRRVPKAALALVLLTVALIREGWFPMAALRAAAAGAFAEENLEAIGLGEALAAGES